MLLVLYTWIISISVMAVLVILLILCVCGCKKKMPRNELLGLAGLVKITNSDLHVDTAGVTSTAIESEESNTQHKSSPSTEQRKTVINVSGTVMRSLPDLPNEVNKAETKSKQVDVVDTGSELYATLEDKTSEHRYAEIGNIVLNRASAQLREPEETISETRLHISNEESSASSSALADIPAASAISGVIAANSDLPYMTPPVLSHYFSGDSQDSAKGYTSISVREPIARIMPSKNETQPETNYSHYTAVYDDSDEMYAAIPDCYTSESETYAQIKPSGQEAEGSEGEVGASSKSTVTANTNDVSNNFSQQQTSSSAEYRSNERRAANSPLPEPPVNIDGMYAKVIKKKKKSNNEPGSANEDTVTVNHLTNWPSSTVEYEKQNVAQYEYLTNAANNENSNNDINNSVPGYETINENASSLAGYETVKDDLRESSDSVIHYESVSEPNYEEIYRSSQPYDTVMHHPNYEQLATLTNSGCTSNVNSNNSGNDIHFPNEDSTANSFFASEPDYVSLTNNNNSEKLLKEDDDTISAGNSSVITCIESVSSSASVTPSLRRIEGIHSDNQRLIIVNSSSNGVNIFCNPTDKRDTVGDIIADYHRNGIGSNGVIINDNVKSRIVSVIKTNEDVASVSTEQDVNCSTNAVPSANPSSNDNDNNNNESQFNNHQSISDLYSKVNKKRGNVT